MVRKRFPHNTASVAQSLCPQPTAPPEQQQGCIDASRVHFEEANFQGIDNFGRRHFARGRRRIQRIRHNRTAASDAGQPFTLEELQCALQPCSSGKAPGVDNTLYEAFFFFFSRTFPSARGVPVGVSGSAGGSASRAHQWGQAGGCRARSECRARPPEALPGAARCRCTHRPPPAAVPAKSGPVPAARRWPACPSTGGERLGAWLNAGGRALCVLSPRRACAETLPPRPRTARPPRCPPPLACNGEQPPVPGTFPAACDWPQPPRSQPCDQHRDAVPHRALHRFTLVEESHAAIFGGVPHTLLCPGDVVTWTSNPLPQKCCRPYMWEPAQPVLWGRRPRRLFLRQAPRWQRSGARWSGRPACGVRFGEAKNPGPPAPGTPVGGERDYGPRRRARSPSMDIDVGAPPNRVHCPVPGCPCADVGHCPKHAASH